MIVLGFMIFVLGFTLGGTIVNVSWGNHFRKWEREGKLYWTE